MKKDSVVQEEKNKKPLPLRVVSGIKRIIKRFCSKARWLVILMIISALANYFLCSTDSLIPYTYGVRGQSKKVSEMLFTNAVECSVNSSGKAVFSFDKGYYGCTAFHDLGTGEHGYTNITSVFADGTEPQLFAPYNFALCDNNEYYAVRKISKNNKTQIISEERIVRISDSNRYIGEVCTIKYDSTERIRQSKISRLHYYDGTVTFATVEKNGVRLYSVDTETQALKESGFYPTDPDGTFTAEVIPVDGCFLFIRSDGNVYRVSFDEPLGESIFSFSRDNYSGNGGNITLAAVSGGKLYVCTDSAPSKVYTLADGTLSEAFDIGEERLGEEHRIIDLGSCRTGDSQSDLLTVCLDDGMLMYNGGDITEENIVIQPYKHPAMYLSEFVNFITQLCLAGLIINIIIRKKTLLYKQMIIIVPMLTVFTVVIAVISYTASENMNIQDISRELEVISGLGAKEFEGYDFSEILEADKDTGEAYREICEKLDGISGINFGDWSEQYIFSIVYRTGDETTAVIVRDDKLTMPLSERDNGIVYNTESLESTFVSMNNFSSFFSDYAGNRLNTSISALSRISDKTGRGRFYFKVSTDTKELQFEREAVFGVVVLIVPLFMLIIVGMISAVSAHITGTIRKATDTVRKMTGGDLSARINYRSKDELGEICSQVNEMGQSLETMFREKDRAERFYYKFVPEKFREFLGKENFTDLSLGDASSRELTVLFFDIRSFSINSEIMTAKENFAFVNVIYGKAGPIIRENNGFIDKYIGDAVMALFESADDAVKCGIELYRAIVLDPETAKELRVSDINIGIGVHTGMAMIGIVGESERLSGTVISDTVNLSSRFESLTKQYKTAMLISKDTVDRLSDPDALDLRYLGIIQVAGVNEVKAVYEVLDCLPDDERSKRGGNSADLREAIRLFHLGRKDNAITALKEINDSGRNDHVSDMYLNYIKEMSDEDKGFVFRFVRK